MIASENLINLLLIRKGCRNDNYGDGKIREAIDVVEFETFELGNTDIFEGFLNIHEINLLPEIEMDEIIEISEDQDSLIELLDEFKDEYLKAIEKFFFEKFSDSKVYAIWLTDEDSAKKYYLSEDSFISKYIIPDNAEIIPISDLGDQGVLFVTNSNPKFWEKELIKTI